MNTKGRTYGLKIGRLLTMAPIVSIPYFGESWNLYSCLLNGPLSFVDPSGFAPG
ncbi:hypothetical protein [Sorangium sp. So ce124]|uniref:hypothetical protein n=1 Tax=Sorangium sp. So ce124 TaxID=3133280 RepID=UPI003F601C35